jgi:hypothetical protein
MRQESGIAIIDLSAKLTTLCLGSLIFKKYL